MSQPTKPEIPALKRGCCADKSCNDITCMNLPKDKTCADCLHIDRCLKLGVAKKENTSCDFFPRKFKPSSKYSFKIV